MNRLLSYFLYFLIALTLNEATAQDFNLNSRRISVQEGLLGNTVNELVQDEQGYIWMATNNGLSRYDGYSTVNYSSFAYSPQQHIEARIGRITYDPAGLLWLATSTYNNFCFDLKKVSFTDWTGHDDGFRQLNKFILSQQRGMFFYGYSFGIRRSQYVEGQFRLTDYTQQNGQLPSNEVLQLIEDDSHNIWIPTDNGIAVLTPDEQLHTVLTGKRIIAAVTHQDRSYFLTDQGEAYIFTSDSSSLTPNSSFSTLPTAIGHISKVNTSFVWQGQWLLFTPQATYSMDIQNGTWRKESGQHNVVNGLNQGTCPGYHFIANQSGQLWIYPDEGPLRTMDLIPNAHFAVNRGRKFHIVDDTQGRLFIATYGNGLFVWNPRTDQLRHFTAQQPNPVIRSNFLLCAVRDHQGNIWIGSEATGAYCLNIMTTLNYVLPEPEHLGDWANAVSCVTQANDSTIIIGTREGRLYLFSPSTGSIRQTASYQSAVRACFIDSQQHLWIGTNGEGLYVDQEHYSTAGDHSHLLPENKIADICQDSLGRIWIATQDGGLLLTRHEAGQPLRFQQFLTRQMNESRIKDLELTPDGTLWIATNNGIYRTDTRQPQFKDELFACYNTANGLFPYDEITTLHYSANDSTLWVGTASSGVVKCHAPQSSSRTSVPHSSLTTQEGLGSNSVYSLIEDPEGYVWAATEDGISRINPRNNIVNTSRPSPILQGNAATENSACLTSSGLLLFGTNHGLVTLHSSLRTSHLSHLTSHITDQRINGQSLLLSFSDFNYDNTQSSLYQYYLEGIDDTWLPMTTQHQVYYPQLPPGHYVFHLRSLGNDNEWLPETSLTVRIPQPWYNTWWAWILYSLIIIALLLYVYHNWKVKFHLHQQMKLQQQLSDFRMQLFTNITHEFRTPLAIIKSAVDKLDGNQTAVKSAQRGVSRMLKLVNLFIEYRKIRTGNLRLQVVEGDIIAFVRDIVQDFWPIANQKEQQITFRPSQKAITLPFDPHILETILYNLLSNAVKYTPEKGAIIVRIRPAEENEGQCLSIIVEDSGPGISPQRQEAMFQPFMHGLASQGGMGIGLYTAYEMAKAHHGALTYQSSTETGGALFTLTLPLTSDCYPQPVSISHNRSQSVITSPNQSQPLFTTAPLPPPLNDLHLAIIEDDPDMMQQLRAELGIYFHIDSYTNGQDALEGIAQDPPSVLLCDVMLPDMDGYAVVGQLRSSHSSLPIIMLSAIDDEQQQLRAYKAGADHYMVKPCDFRLLVAKAMQLITKNSQSTILQSASPLDSSKNSQSTTSQSSPLLTTQADKVFLDKLAMLTAQHLSDYTFSIDLLAEKMSMGRTKFYGKVKELTGMSPNKYLMQQRMQKAADLLGDGELNISEVSYRVGIQDPSYFNKCFKAHYGVVPSKYVKPAEQ